MNLNCVLIGLGHVGRSFIQLIMEKKEKLKREFDLNCIMVAIIEYDGALINKNGINLEEVLKEDQKIRDLSYWKNGAKFSDFVSDFKIDICIETTPTNHETGEPALTHINDALNNNINVISSNKGPFYLKYKEIHELAKQNNCLIRYEATVASCVPALSIKKSLIGNTITEIKAILNGTSNYILSRMTAEGISFSMALKEAQELGYAEADPTLDIEGYDAAGKLVIIANELFGWSKTIKDVKITGISKISPQAIELAKADGLLVKPLAIIEDDNLIVEPRLIERNSPLNISANLNVIVLYTKYAGPIVLKGRGAGGFEAASAILNDLIDISMNRK